MRSNTRRKCARGSMRLSLAESIMLYVAAARSLPAFESACIQFFWLKATARISRQAVMLSISVRPWPAWRAPADPIDFINVAASAVSIHSLKIIRRGSSCSCRTWHRSSGGLPRMVFSITHCAKQDPFAAKAFEFECRPHDTFDGAVVLFDDVVEVS